MELPDKSQPQARPKKVAVVPKGSAQVSTKGSSGRFLAHVFAESPRDMMAKVGRDVVMPRFKEGIESAFQSFLHGMLWGGGSGPTNHYGVTQGSVIKNGVIMNAVDYNSLSNPAVMASRASANMSGPYRDLTVANRQLAEALLASLVADINEYRMTTVADLYEAANITPDPSHALYGWHSVDGARIVQERDGVKLMLPKPIRIS